MRNRILAACMLTLCAALTGCGNEKEPVAAEPAVSAVEEAPEEDSLKESEQEAGEQMSRLIEEQTFKVKLEGWGDVTFASFAPEEGRDVEFKLLKDGEVVYEFPGLYADNSLSDDRFLQVAAVSFKDYNEDEKTDVIVINEYERTESGQKWFEPRVYIQQDSGNDYEQDNLLSEYLMKNHCSDSIAAILAAKESYQNYAASLDGSRSTDAQLEIMAENVVLWKTEPEYANEVHRYAVTNLDLDDKMELVISHMGGTGAYTYSRIYEVNDSFDGLLEWQNDYQEGDSQLDIMEDSAAVYHAGAKDCYYYIFTDYEKASATEHIERTGALVIEGNRIYEQPLDQDAEKTFDGMTKYTVTFGWQEVSGLDGLETEDVKQLLEESYSRFEVK